jgi:hypothetical protein
MKKHFLKALVAVSLFATLSSCSKDDKIDLKPITKSSHPLDPYNFGYIDLGDGELYYYEDSLSSFSKASQKYLGLTSPLSLDKYKNGAQLDSVCNKELSLYFESKVLKAHSKSEKWGVTPGVSEEYAPTVTIKSGIETKIKLSKLVSMFGFELNSPYKGLAYGITVTYWNSKLNMKIPYSVTSYLEGTNEFGTRFGSSGGAMLYGLQSVVPFDEIRITFETSFTAPTLNPPFDISFAGFRYKLAK